MEGSALDEVASNFGFRLMSLSYKFRDLLIPRRKVLKEVGIKPGFAILDYGCGPGGYINTAAALVGESGKIYALDIRSLAVQMVQSIIAKEQLTNVETICSDCKTGLPDTSIDVVLLYDTFHILGDPNGVLGELYRVLKPSGILSFNDHHMEEEEIISKITDRGLFRLRNRGKMTYSFVKEAGEV